MKYSLALDGYRRLPGVRVMNLWSFPTILKVSKSARLAPRLPSVACPDLRVAVRCAEPELIALGTQYPQGPHALPEESGDEFGLYQEAFTGEILVGPFERRYTKDRTALFVLATARPSDEESLLQQVYDVSQTVTSLLRRELGEPAVQLNGVILFSSPHASSFSIGSFVGINATQLRSTGGSSDVRRSSLLSVLAHEYAHAWWGYRVFWDRLMLLAIVSEALAIATQYVILDSTQDAAAVRVWQVRQLGKTLQTVGRSDEWLRGQGASAAGIWAATALVRLFMQEPNTLRTLFRRIWKLGQSEVMRIEVLQEELNQAFRTGAGDCVAAALNDPHPIVGRLRLLQDPEHNRWALRVGGSNRDMSRLAVRISAIENPHKTICNTGNRIEIQVLDHAEGVKVATLLRAYHLVSERDRRLLLFNRRPWLRRLWEWNRAALQRTMSEDISLARWLRALLASGVALVMNPDDPSGFEGLVKVTGTLSRSISQRLSRRAAARDFFRSELAAG